MTKKNKETKTFAGKSHTELVSALRTAKKDLQKTRFRTTPATQEKTSRHRELRKRIARIATQLTQQKSHANNKT